MTANELSVLEVTRVKGACVYSNATLSATQRFNIATDQAVYVLDDFLNRPLVDGLEHMPLTFRNADEGAADVKVETSLGQMRLMCSTENGKVYTVGELIIKVPEMDELFEAEYKALTKLKARQVDGVCKLRGFCNEGKNKALLLTYHGLALDSFVGSGLKRMFVKLVSTLKAIHECGILHRDIRIANVVFSDVLEVVGKHAEIVVQPFIIDFGLAVFKTRFRSTFVGTPLYAPQAHLSASENDLYIFTKSTDLESLVKVSVLMTLKDHSLFRAWNRKCLTEERPEYIKKIYRWWETVFSTTGIYREALDAARSGDYEKLARCFERYPFFD
jgi:serine/threonine protein kinase